jgi:hypothetical protein
MRAVLIAVDYVKDTDGTFKILELNTGIAIAPANMENYFNKSVFDNFLLENNITEINLISIGVESVENLIDLENTQNIFQLFTGFLKSTYSGTTTFETFGVDRGAVIIPDIEDSPNKLIIRTAYDSTALIDETYARDNYEFLKLVHDMNPTSIPKTYFNHPSLGIDTIQTSIRDNGVYPNFIVKERYPTTDYTEYPKIYKIDTLVELQTLKDSLPVNTILQEYIFNPNDLLNGKTKTYRTVEMVHGELNILNVIEPYIHTAHCPIDITVDYDDNKQVQYWERPKYIQKYKKSFLTKYICDDTNVLLGPNNTFIQPSTLTVGQTIKTVSVYGMNEDEQNFSPYTFTGVTTDIISGSTIVDANVVHTTSSYKEFWLKRIVLDDGTVFSDIEESTVMCNKNGITKFKRFEDLEIGESLYVININTNEMELKTISTADWVYDKQNIYEIDVEETDTYITLQEEVSTLTYGLIQHNRPGDCFAYADECGACMWCPEPCGTNPRNYVCGGTICCSVDPSCDCGCYLAFDPECQAKV